MRHHSLVKRVRRDASPKSLSVLIMSTGESHTPNVYHVIILLNITKYQYQFTLNNLNSVA